MRATGQPISMLRAAAIGFAIAALTGCRSGPAATQPAATPQASAPAAPAAAPADELPPDPQHPMMETIRTDSPLYGNAEPVMIKKGKLPLVYLVGAAGQFSVMDETSNAFVAGGYAAAQSIVSADARNGVRIGGQRVGPGSLNDEHDYGIYLIPPGGNATQQIIRRPRNQ